MEHIIIDPSKQYKLHFGDKSFACVGAHIQKAMSDFASTAMSTNPVCFVNEGGVVEVTKEIKP